jgi:hypothetical protein
MWRMLSLMVQIASCSRERPPRAYILFNPVRSRTPLEPRNSLTPEHAVLMMAETCYLAESVTCYPPLFDDLRDSVTRPTDTAETVAMSAVAAAREQGASAILVLSTSGNSARLISKYRPAVPILTSRHYSGNHSNLAEPDSIV